MVCSETFIISDNEEEDAMLSSARRHKKINKYSKGIYVHSNPPRASAQFNSSGIRQWLRNGEIDNLTRIVLQGDGHRLLGQYTPDLKARAFLRTLPKVLARIDMVHEAAAKGNKNEMEFLLKDPPGKFPLELSKDPITGLGVLHKCVIHGHKELLEFLCTQFPATQSIKDKENRIALHYTGCNENAEDIWTLLVSTGADTQIIDKLGNNPGYYMNNPRELMLPSPNMKQGQPITTNGVLVKPSNIRIWIHDRDLGRLQQLVWEGYGDKLRTETSSQPIVKRFLNAVPYIMGTIKDVHSAAVNNDLDLLHRRTGSDVPKDIFLSKDQNGLNPLHKAAGLGNDDIVTAILEKAPEALKSKDNFGRTPLHYAAGLKDNSVMYDKLVEAGAFMEATDNKDKEPSYYKTKPKELDLDNLKIIPEAPRTSHIFPPTWDWSLLYRKEEEANAAADELASKEDIWLDNQKFRVPPIIPTQPKPKRTRQQQIVGTSDTENLFGETTEKIINSSSNNSDSAFEDITAELEQKMDDEELTTNTNALTNFDETEEDKTEIDEGIESELVDNNINTDVSKNEDAIIKSDDATKNIMSKENSTEKIDDNNDNNENIEKLENKPESNKEDGSNNMAANNNNSNEDNKNGLLDNTNIDNGDSASNIVQDNVVKNNEDDSKNKETNEQNKIDDELKNVKTNEDSNTENDIKNKTFNKSEMEESSIANNSIVLLKDQDTNKTDKNNSTKSNNVKNNKANNKTIDDDNKSSDGGEDTNGEKINDKDNKNSKKKTDEKNNKKINQEDDKTKKKRIKSKLSNTRAKSQDNVGDLKNDENSNNARKQRSIRGSKSMDRSGSQQRSRKVVGTSITSNNNNFNDISTGGGLRSDGIVDDINNTTTTAGIEGIRPRVKRMMNNNTVTDEDDNINYEELVATGNMEALADAVLKGRGDALLSFTSDNPDVQLFLNNVPQYMSKIEKVHRAARLGDLRAVQSSLDRRKFAVAVDSETSLKPTPLHAAVLFGRTTVLRYLAGRFPETMHAQDAYGRSPLHYAAALPDNGHFYSLLVTLGADKTVADIDGNVPEFYMKNPGQLSLKNLMEEYQNRTNKDPSMIFNLNQYSDKGADFIRSGYPIFAPDEGQYLAASLGEPLIKGLTEVAQLKPKEPIIHLANYLLKFCKTNKVIDENISVEESNVVEDEVENVNNEDDKKDNIKEEDEINKIENIENDKNEIITENTEIIDDDDDEDIDEERGSLKSFESSFKPINRDEHGQSMLHFACARSHGRNALYQLLQELQANIALRDQLYRTARDIAEQVGLPDNVLAIDRYVVAIAARGEDDKLNELLIDGYDHLIDTKDENDNILDVVKSREHESTLKLLDKIPSFETKRENLHRAIRFGDLEEVKKLLTGGRNKKLLGLAKNRQSRCSLHIAVLSQHEPVVEFIANKFTETLHMGDNLMRMPLHYAMGVDKVEELSTILINAGAERVVKDLKGRQPSYYFMNKTDIQKLQDEEDMLRI